MADIQKWQRELISFNGIKSTFIIDGNISDKYLSGTDESDAADFYPLNETLNRIFNPNPQAQEYDCMFCDPLFGFSDPLGERKINALAERYQALAGQQRDESPSPRFIVSASGGMAQISEIIRAAITKRDSEKTDRSIAVIVNFASRLLSTPEHLSTGENDLFLNLLYASKNAIRVKGNIKTLILVVDKSNDIPAWFYLNNPNVRMLTIPNPERTIRECFVDHCFDVSLTDETAEKTRNKFIDMTENMKLLELDELRRMFIRNGSKVEELIDTVAVYKFGFKENKWEKMRGRIGGDFETLIEKRIKGQEKAVTTISRVIKRAISGLSGLQHANGANKPRGIMFLAGPTGTGKTETVKAITEILFGDEKALIRFDMSEYSAENADQKLFGAPPGYVGYDQGGQLTNAVKANPFSVLLFDEIEKAHPTIMDKFLQILEDGRMTDGQGNTVFFSETLIFFTSNAGITNEVLDLQGRVIKRETVIKPGSSYDEIQNAVEIAMKTQFKPEVINRIGKNIIVFDYITAAATVEILDAQIQNICREMLRSNKIIVTVDNAAKDTLKARCLKDDIREMGGRGIGNIVESDFLNPLAEYIFNENIQKGASVKTTAKDGNLKIGG